MGTPIGNAEIPIDVPSLPEVVCYRGGAYRKSLHINGVQEYRWISAVFIIG